MKSLCVRVCVHSLDIVWVSPYLIMPLCSVAQDLPPLQISSIRMGSYNLTRPLSSLIPVTNACKTTIGAIPLGTGKVEINKWLPCHMQHTFYMQECNADTPKLCQMVPARANESKIANTKDNKTQSTELRRAYANTQNYIKWKPSSHKLTFSTDTSMPRSPLATMMPSVTSKISSKFSTPSQFSILEMILTWKAGARYS